GVLTASGRKLVIRIDASGTVTPIHSDFPSTSEPLIIALDPGSTTAYASTEDGRIFYTPDPDGAAGWTDLSSGRPMGVAEVYGLTVSQGSTAFAIAGMSGSQPALYSVSTVGVWTAQGLVPAPAESTGDYNVRLLADPDLATRLYLAQGRVVYQLDSAGGASWNVTDLSDFGLSGAGGLPGGYINDLWVGKAGSHKLLRATVPMRGLWEREVDPPAAAGSTVYLRKHPADLGWITPTAEGMPSPFGTSAGSLGHWLSPDIKVENALSGAPAGYEYQTDPEYPGILTPPTQLDHVAFDMLRSDASGMTPGRAAHVHVQVHNRDFTAAGNLSVWLIFCNAASMVPALPTGFWSRFHPDGTIDTATPLTGGWTAVGDPRALGAPAPNATAPAVVSWDWPQATTIAASSHYCLFAIVHGPTPYSAADQVAATGADPTSVDALVPLVTQLGQRNVFWLPPGAPPGPPIPWLGEPGVAMIALGFHNPLRSPVTAALLLDGAILPKAAQLAVMAVGASARLLAAGKPRVGTRLPLGAAERVRLLPAGERDDDDRGFHLRADLNHRAELEGVALPAHARGTLVVAVRLPEKMEHGARYTVDVVQRVRDGKGRVITGGAQLLLGAGPYLD
ncbi:MAG TPA: hypothetical protein VJ487_12890, partial [Alphaproteobacteria bacterium]|nr:hypothetical protein [Alphaproteobacteria bacterium]